MENLREQHQSVNVYLVEYPGGCDYLVEYPGGRYYLVEYPGGCYYFMHNKIVFAQPFREHILVSLNTESLGIAFTDQWVISRWTGSVVRIYVCGVWQQRWSRVISFIVICTTVRRLVAIMLIVLQSVIMVIVERLQGQKSCHNGQRIYSDANYLTTYVCLFLKLYMTNHGLVNTPYGHYVALTTLIEMMLYCCNDHTFNYLVVVSYCQIVLPSFLR